MIATLTARHLPHERAVSSAPAPSTTIVDPKRDIVRKNVSRVCVRCASTHSWMGRSQRRGSHALAMAADTARNANNAPIATSSGRRTR